MNEPLSRLRNANIGNLEKKLSQLITPVMPDTEFVNSLKNKITNAPTIFVETTKKNSRLVAVGIGVMVSTIIVWLIRQISSHRREE